MAVLAVIAYKIGSKNDAAPTDSSKTQSANKRKWTQIKKGAVRYPVSAPPSGEQDASV
jgi:hypothetical protein